MDPLDYASAGVDINAGNALVERIKPMAQSTHIPGVMGSLGGFAGLFALDVKAYQEPVLVSGTDGVGTKLCLSMQMQQFDTIGIDLVAMCVNDIIVTGAKPLFFLDYFATGHLQLEQGSQIIKGIAEGCKIAGAALLGGETAEMPGLYQGEDYDLAGFCVGVVERSKIMQADRVEVGDAIIGLASNGIHSNGYSLVRKVLEISNTDLNSDFNGETFGDCLLRPTRIYVKPVLAALEQFTIKGMAHITGGGLLENIPRTLPKGVHAEIRSERWSWPAIFNWLQNKGNIETFEMLRTFNCGIGYVLIVAKSQVKDCLAFFESQGEMPYHLGEIRKSELNSQTPEVLIL